MKSSFLLVLTLLCTSVAWGQARSTRSGVGQRAGSPARKATPAPAKKTQAPAKTETETVSKTEIVNKSSFDKFYDRLKIGYFGAFQGSSLGQWDNYAADEHGEKFKDYAHNVFNQLSFNYNFGWKMNFVFNPRWTINTGSTKYHHPKQKGVVQIEDALVGLQGTLYSNADKKFNFWARFGARLPVNRVSREQDITWQPEMFSMTTYDFNSKWQLGSYLQLRWWVFQQRYNPERYRVYVAPYLQYAITEKDKVAIWYENYSENRRRWKSINGKNPVFKEQWQTAMVSYSRDLTPKVNFMPFLAYHLNTTYASERPLDPVMLGFWLSWQIK